MLETGIAFLILLLVYIVLRMQGGHGATISFSMGPANTPEGKRMRALVVWALVASAAAAMLVIFGSGFTREQEAASLLVFLAIALAGLPTALRRSQK